MWIFVSPDEFHTQLLSELKLESDFQTRRVHDRRTKSVKSDTMPAKKLSIDARIFCEPTVPRMIPQELFDNLIETHEKLKELDLTYYHGTVSIIETEVERKYLTPLVSTRLPLLI